MEQRQTPTPAATTTLDKSEKSKEKKLETNRSSNSMLDAKKLTSQDLKRLKRMNQQFAHVFTGGKHLVMTIPGDSSKITEVSFEMANDFKYRFLHKPQIAAMNAGEAWLRWEDKCFYEGGLEFSPGFKLESPTKDKFNLFRGFPLKPVAGDVEPFLFHVREVICNNDENLTKYVLQFFAHLLQKPQEKPVGSLLLKSGQGTGKNALLLPLFRILGDYALMTNGEESITGRFNSSLANKLLVFGDEVDLRNRKTLDRMKPLISEDSLQIEFKGREKASFPNFIRFIFATNLDQVLRADTRERRYTILEPSDKYSTDTAYFNNYFDWVDNRNGAAHLMHYLLNYDISDFNAYKAQKSSGLTDEKLANLSTVAEFFYEELSKELPFRGLGQNTAAKALEEQFKSFIDVNRHDLSAHQARSTLSKFISTMGVPKRGRSGRGNGIAYDLSNTTALRQSFAKYLDEDIKNLFA